MKNQDYLDKVRRHGDVTMNPGIEPLEIPNDAVKEYEGTKFTVALGETTGHSHTLVADKPFTVFKKGDVRYLKFDFPTTIEHQEHKQIVIQPGVYRQDQEREVDHFSHTVRKVVD